MPKLATTRLSDTLVERAKPKAKPYEIRDAGQEGLVLRVLPSGSKRSNHSFSVRILFFIRFS